MRRSAAAADWYYRFCASTTAGRHGRPGNPIYSTLSMQQLRRILHEHGDHQIPMLLQSLGRGCTDTDRSVAATMSWLPIGTLASRFRAKCTKQRCKMEPWQHRAIAYLRPAWASLITNCTPEKLRSRKRLRKALQKASSSLLPRSCREPRVVP